MARYVSLFLPIALFLVVFASVRSVNGNYNDNGLTPEEIKLVPKFRVIVKDIIYKDWMNTDEYLARWLRVGDHNLKAARDAMQVSLEWRQSNGIDRILEEDLSDVENEFKVIFEGVDKIGHPLSIFNIGSVDIRKMVLSGRSKRIARLFAQCLELVDTVHRDLRNITQSYFIIDLAGFNLRQHACVQCAPTAISLFQLYEVYYPDIAYRAIALNTPRAFVPLYQLVKPFLSGSSQRALQLFDSDAEQWKNALLEEIDADQLPKQYGGTRFVQSKTLSTLKKTHPYVKAAFDRAAASATKKSP